jgi:hypothetical protein
MGAAGWLWLAAIPSVPAEAGVLIPPGLAPSVESNIVQVHCAWYWNEHGRQVYRCWKGPPAYAPFGGYGVVPYGYGYGYGPSCYYNEHGRLVCR